MNKYDVTNKGPDGDTGQNSSSNEKTGAGKYQKWIRAANAAKKDFNEWAKAGNKLYRGYNKNSDPIQASLVSEDLQSSPVLSKVNFIRQPVERQIQKTYARNPTFMAKPNQPIFVDAPPVPAPPVPAPPQQDPMTGMITQPIDPQTGQPQMIPQINPMTGQQVMVPQIDPQTGQPVQIDVSNQIVDVIEQLMAIVFEETNFKAEAKACTREAHHSPASIMQVGYQFNESLDQDEIYFRRRSFKKFIIDPDAEIYEGTVRRCRFMGLQWELTKDEAKKLGLKWENLIDKANKIEQGSDCEPKAIVYNIWDKANGVVVWCPESGMELAKEPQEWPWDISGFPFKILKFTEDTDQQFSKSLVLEAAPIQEELTVQRQEITDNTTNSRPYTMFDPDFVDADKMDAISRRDKKGFVAVKGMASLPGEPMKRIGDSNLTAEYYAHYQRNKSELNEVLGTSANEALQATDTTAKESEIIASNSGASTSSKIDIQTDFLNACAKTAVEIMSQTYTTPRVTQVTGRDNEKYWVKWVGAQILQNISIKVETGSTEREDTAYNRQIALNMLEVMKGIPGMDVIKLAMEVLKDHGKRNPEEYRMDNQEMAPGVMPAAPAGVGAGATTGADVSGSITNQVSPLV